MHIAAGESNCFGVDVGLHPGSVLCTYVFPLLMDVLTEDMRKDVPGSMMFANYMLRCGDDYRDDRLERPRKGAGGRTTKIASV